MDSDALVKNSNGVQSVSDYADSRDRVVASDNNDHDHLSDLVSANNDKNEKLNEMSSTNQGSNADEDSEEGDDFDDDWFLKLTNSKDGPRVPPVVDANSELGMHCAKIPLLCEDDLDFKEKTMKTLRVGLKKIWKRGSATITVEDPTYKVTYLGNVLTGWAKGEGCIEKPLNSLWKNYNGSSKPDVQMKITVTQSGLKAVTKDHGLIEYWSHRITYCTVPAGLPRIFCWIYRHEGRKLKQELRCHAILCSKESVAARMATTLKLRLAQALLEFKRDKLLRQNARLSLANSVYDNPSLPRRKILLSTGCHNYKPPLERSKSAPKLMSIEESLEEEEMTPKGKRKFSESEEEKNEVGAVRNGEDGSNKTNAEDKCEYKLANLNFVRKLCSSIENLVESTSNYSKKFFSERKLNKDFYLSMKKSEEPMLKKDVEDIGKEISKQFKCKKNVTFGVKGQNFTEPIKYAELNNSKVKKQEKSRGPLEITLEVREKEEDDCSKLKLLSASGCRTNDSSLESPETCKVSDSVKEETEFIMNCSDRLEDCCETPIERLHTYLNNCSDALLDKVVLHPTGRENSDKESGLQEEKKEVAFDDCRYVEVTENLVKRLNLDSKEKDVPYHKIIKSTALGQRRLQSSCLQI